jgi:ComF family protein
MDLAPLALSTTRRVLEPVLAVVFPARCVACSVLLRSPLSGPMCSACWRRLPRHAGPLCACGQRLPGAESGSCGRCRRGLNPLGEGISLGPYDGALRDAVHALKYGRQVRLAAQFARALWSETGAARVLSTDAVLVPVPLHPRRLRERGFNQAALVAAGLARLAGARCEPGAVVRRRETPSQTGLSAAARRANVAGAFVVRRRARVSGRHVVLVDDVLTTGATVRACAQALRQAGAARISVVTVARTL